MSALLTRKGLARLATSLDFELPIDYQGAFTAPLAAVAEINGWDYTGEPLLACLNTFLTLIEDVRGWKPSQSSEIPHYAVFVHFAHRLSLDLFECPDIGALRVQLSVWLGIQINLLNRCRSGAADDREKEDTKRLLTTWNKLANPEGPGLILG